MHRRYSAVKVMSGNIEPATLRRKTFSGKDLELVVSTEKNVTNTVHHLSVLFHFKQEWVSNNWMQIIVNL